MRDINVIEKIEKLKDHNFVKWLKLTTHWDEIIQNIIIPEGTSEEGIFTIVKNSLSAKTFAVLIEEYAIYRIWRHYL